MIWLGIWFGISNAYSVWSNWVGQNRKTDKEHDQDCIEEGFLLTRVQFDRDGEGNREALGMGYCNIEYLRWIRTGISLIQEKHFTF